MLRTSLITLGTCIVLTSCFSKAENVADSPASPEPGAASHSDSQEVSASPMEVPTDLSAPGQRIEADSIELLRWPLGVQMPKVITAAYDRVVLVTIDTLRADHVSAYGYPRPTTPFLDSLAAKGVLFEKAMSSVSHTAPSHASMLTGLPPVAHGVLFNGDTLDEDAMDLGKIFGLAGYDTGAFLNTNFLRSVATAFDYKVTKESTAGTVDAALEWVDEEARSDQFFMWIHSYEPHRWTNPSNISPADVAQIQAGTTLDDAELYAYLAKHMGLPALHEGQPFPELFKGKVLNWLAQIDTRRAYLDAVDGYDSLVLHADQQLQRLYQGFEKRGLGGRTLWVITSDHGEGIGSHGVVGHGGHMFQEQLHVPLVMHAADGSLGPRRVSQLVQHVDLFPTLAASLGVGTGGIEDSRAGANLWPLIHATGDIGARLAFGQRRPQKVTEKSLKFFTKRRPGRGAPDVDLVLEDEKSWNAVWTLQSLNYKYVLRRSSNDSFFDLHLDPLERNNLYGKGGTEEDALAQELENRVRFFLSIRREAFREKEIEPEIIDELRALGYVE